MNEGLVAFLKDDLEKAFQLVGQAQQMGLEQAASQMEEFRKIRKE